MSEVTSGPEHYAEAALLLEEPCDYGCPHIGCTHHLARIAEAQVHATLALAAATALRPGQAVDDDGDPEFRAWYETAGVKPGVTS